MKNILTIVILLFLFINIKAQNELLAGEFIIKFENRPISWNITVKIEAIGTVWNQYHNITTEYLGGAKSYSSQTSPPLNFWHASDLDWDYQGWEPVLSLGLYEVSIWEGSHKRAWFFIDYRTSHLPYAAVLQLIDVVLNYDVTNKDFEFTYPNLGSVTNGSYYPIWELKELVQLQTNDLEDYWENCLAVFPSSDKHPFIVWGPYPSEVYLENVNYQIWRKYGGLDWAILDVVNSSTFNYEDKSLSITGLGPGTTVLYKVRTVEGGLPNNPVTNFTNTFSIVVDGYNPGKISISNESKKVNEYVLFQNYPNPFNPITVINYSLPIPGQVSLKIFDILGSEVATLVNELKEAGTYTIEFNASNLTSGIYFYQLKAGDYIETKKLILQK